MDRPYHGYVNLGSGWRRPAEELGDYGEAYRNAAKQLAAALAEDPAYDSFAALPIVFLYRHATELYLKGVLWAGSRLLSLIDRQSAFNATLKASNLKSHRLRPLLPALRELFKELNWSESYEKIAPFVESLDKADPESFAHRYPTDTKGNASLPEALWFNVLAFANDAESCLGEFYNALFSIEARVESAKEELREGAGGEEE